jgi:cytochrome c-type biogenesis protein CcmE
MKPKQLKFLAGALVILAALVYFGYQGFNASMSYFQTVPELYESGEKAYTRSIRVQGEVLPGSIQRRGQATTFIIGPTDFKVPENFVVGPDNHTLRIEYVGKDAIPDTFRDYASAIVTGRLRRDGTFEGTHIQAQCASKYEREMAAGMLPVAGLPDKSE